MATYRNFSEGTTSSMFVGKNGDELTSNAPGAIEITIAMPAAGATAPAKIVVGFPPADKIDKVSTDPTDRTIVRSGHQDAKARMLLVSIPAASLNLSTLSETDHGFTIEGEIDQRKAHRNSIDLLIHYYKAALERHNKAVDTANSNGSNNGGTGSNGNGGTGNGSNNTGNTGNGNGNGGNGNNNGGTGNGSNGNGGNGNPAPQTRAANIGPCGEELKFLTQDQADAVAERVWDAVFNGYRPPGYVSSTTRNGSNGNP